jgi:AcrR family transcriptional regulator
MDQQSTRQRIIDGTKTVIHAKGFGNATTKEIARAAGVAEGSIYNNFGDKFDLIVATVLEGHVSMAKQLKALIESKRKESVEKMLVRIARASIAYYTEVLPIVSSVLADPELHNRYRALGREQKRGPAVAVEVLAAYLAEEQEEGNLRATHDCDMLAASLLGPCFLYAFTSLLLDQGLLSMDERRFAVQLSASLLSGA